MWSIAWHSTLFSSCYVYPRYRYSKSTLSSGFIPRRTGIASQHIPATPLTPTYTTWPWSPHLACTCHHCITLPQTLLWKTTKIITQITTITTRGPTPPSCPSSSPWELSSLRICSSTSGPANTSENTWVSYTATHTWCICSLVWNYW